MFNLWLVSQLFGLRAAFHMNREDENASQPAHAEKIQLLYQQYSAVEPEG